MSVASRYARLLFTTTSNFSSILRSTYISQSTRRSISSTKLTGNKPIDPLLKNALVHKRGEKYDDVREYILLPPNLMMETNADYDIDETLTDTIQKARYASLYAKRNIIFGAKVHNNTDYGFDFIEACTPLLQSAMEDAGMYGDQVQALATLNGLCGWVRSCLDELENNGNDDRDASFGCGSAVLSDLYNKSRDESSEAIVLYEAIRAIATSIPRPGHSVVGVGTYRDAKAGWEKLAKEYANLQVDGEVALYRKVGNAQLVSVEYLADTSEPYLKEAGGSMVRLFFL